MALSPRPKPVTATLRTVDTTDPWVFAQVSALRRLTPEHRVVVEELTERLLEAQARQQAPPQSSPRTLAPSPLVMR